MMNIMNFAMNRTSISVYRKESMMRVNNIHAMLKAGAKVLATALLVFTCSSAIHAQDLSFSQTYQAPLYLSPSQAGFTNGTRFGLNYRNQWPGIGAVYQDYSVWADLFLERFNSGLGLMWVCDNSGKGLLVDNEARLLYSYDITVMDNLYVRPGIAFEFGQRKLDQSKMVTYTDITSDGKFVPGGSSIEFERTHKARFDAAASVMVYNEDFGVTFTVDHMLQPDASFTDTKDKIGLKWSLDANYKITYEPSYRGREPKTITLASNFKHQYSYNQLELGAFWYYYPIEVGLSYRGLFFKVAGELKNNDAVIPNIGINFNVKKKHAFRLGYSYDVTISELSAFGNGAHEVSIIYRMLPSDVKSRSFKMKPVPCSEPIMGYSYTGSGSRSGSGFGYGRRRSQWGHSHHRKSRRK